ncbi:MAG: type II secretion system F family protein [Candidatus Pacebacteria bacterium]|nr:type II secretion system F family protein [Candidatus Paceibacterota bacterium]
MAKYFYTAKSIRGEEKTGEAEAKDEHQLARALRQEGFILISAEMKEGAEKRKFSMHFSIFDKVGLKEKIFFVRNLRIMIAAGISLPRSLNSLAELTKNKKFKKTILEIVEEVNKGKNFADSLSKHPDVFSELFCSLVAVGEESGTLEEVLQNLTVQMEKQNELSSKLKGAMIYPVVIICAMIGIGILMLIMVVPPLSATFADLGVELPPMTRAVIFLGKIMSEKWYFLLILLIIFVFSIRSAINTKSGKRRIDKILLKIPIISQLIKKSNSASAVRTVGSLVGSGVTMIRALEITAGVLGNVYFKESMLDAVEKVRKGKKLSEALRPYENLYSLIVVQMLEVGEETGETSDILQKLADFFDEEVAIATKNFATIIEPALMLVVGGAIGFFAVSMIQPLYSMLGSIK